MREGRKGRVEAMSKAAVKAPVEHVEHVDREEVPEAPPPPVIEEPAAVEEPRDESAQPREEKPMSFFDEMLETAETLEDWKVQGNPTPKLDKLDGMLRVYAGTSLNPGNLRLFDFEVAKVIMPYYFIPATKPIDTFKPEDAQLFALRGMGKQEFFNVSLFMKSPTTGLHEISQMFKKPGQN